MQQPSAQSSTIDALKAGASQLIVLHHLAAYGPISDALQASTPALVDWLYGYARMAVQVFLVVGGYLAARSFAASASGSAGFPARAIVQRYLRLATPYLGALLLAVLAAAFARGWLSDEVVPSPPRARQVLAHALMLHRWLDYESLSAGVWYVAIDLQLFATLAILLWLGRTLGAAGAPGHAARWPGALSLTLIGGFASASLFWFNRNAAFDDWALYFFAAYAMGAAVHWIDATRHRGRWLAAMTGLVAVALLVDFRWRLAIALVTALTLAWAQRAEITNWPGERLMRFAGGISYSLFLVHFPVILLTNAIYSRLGLDGTAAGFAGAAFAWTGSIALAVAFHRWFETPLARLFRGPRVAPAV
jgi:peptidoglycan/LPS O-acetylase OafA/YrhL